MEYAWVVALAVAVIVLVYFVTKKRSFKPLAVAVVKELYLYPIKSTYGIKVEEAEVGEFGFVYDREWMLVDDSNNFLSQRTFPQMARIRTSINKAEGKLEVRAPDMPVLTVPLDNDDKGESLTVTVFGKEMIGNHQGEEAEEWFTRYLAAPTSMVRFPTYHNRAVKANYKPGATLARGTDSVFSYADQFPYLVANTQTLEEVRRDTIDELGPENAVTIRNFRPNIVIEGEAVKPWSELLFDKVHIGASVVLHLTQSCTRCKLTTVVPEKGVFGGEQPLKHLRDNHDQSFGMHAVHTSKSRGKTVRVGDPFVVETGRTSPAIKKKKA